MKNKRIKVLMLVTL